VLKVSVSGIRGIWGESLTHEIVLGYTKAFVQFLGPCKKIALGSDTRKTRNLLKNLIFSVLESYGYEILDLGIVPTPLVLYAVKEKNLDGGIVISASHNPAPWNALKLIQKGGFFLNQEEVDQVQNYYQKGSFLPYNNYHLGKTQNYSFILEDYLKQAQKLVDINLIQQAQFTVVADGVNGTANMFFDSLFSLLKVKAFTLFTDINKDFEREAEPLPQNLETLSKEVVQKKAHIGLAYDPDADRLALVDEKGRAVGEDWTLALALLNILEKNPSAFVVNLSTSLIADEIAKKMGVAIFKAKVGEIHVTQAMLKKNLPVGGEGNGGVIYFPINHCRDSLIATLLVLEYLAKTKKPLSAIVDSFPKLFMIKDKIPFLKNLSLETIMDSLTHYLEQHNLTPIKKETSDGIRLDYPKGWIQIRASNTEPIIRIMGESYCLKTNQVLVDFLKKHGENKT